METKQPIIDDGDHILFNCPHCHELTQVLKSQINCQIFRHAVYFQTLPPTEHTYTPEYRENVASYFDSILIPGKVTDMILNYVGSTTGYIPTEPINPHMPKEQCDELVKQGKVLGCAKPFRLIGNHVDICDYI